MPFPSRWRQILKEERAKVPAGAPFDEYKKAAKRAAARYHGVHTEQNPKGSANWLLIGLLLVGGWIAVQGLGRTQQSS